MVLVAAVRGVPSVWSKCGSFSAQICTRKFVFDSALDSDLFLLQKVSVPKSAPSRFVCDSALGSDLFLLQEVSVPISAPSHSSVTVP